MTTKTYNNVDELPDLNLDDKKPKYNSVDELPDLSVKKKSGSLSFDHTPFVSEAQLLSEEKRSDIDLINKADELSKKTTATTSAGTGGGTVSFSKDIEAGKESDTIKEQLRLKGYSDKDIEELSVSFRDFPKDAKGVDFNELLAERKENPVAFERHLNSYKWQNALFKEVRKKEGQDAEATISNLLSLQKHGDYTTKRLGTQDIVKKINETVEDPELRKKLISQVAIDRAASYGVLDESKWQSFQNDPIYQSNPTANNYHITALNFLEDTDPEQYEIYKRFMSVNPEGKLGDEDFKRGYEVKSRELETIGMNLQAKALEEELTGLVNAQNKGQISQRDVERYNQLYPQYESLLKDVEGQKQRYPMATNMDADKLMQEAVGQRNSATKRFLLGVGENVDDFFNFIGDAAQSPFRSGKDKIIDDLEDFGKKEFTQTYQRYRTQANQFIQKDGKFNFTPSAIFNTISDVGADIVPSLFTSAMTAGIGNASRLKELATLFGTTYGTVYNDYYTQAIRENIKNPTTYATLHTAIEAASELMNPDLDAVRKMVKPTSTLGVMLKNTTKKEWDDILKSSSGKFGTAFSAVVQGGKEGVKNSLRETFFEEVPGQVVGNVSDQQLFGKDTELTDDLKSTIVNTIVGTLPLSILGIGGQYTKLNQSQKYTLYEIAQNKDKYILKLESDLEKGLISEEKANQVRAIVEKSASTLQDLSEKNTITVEQSDEEKADVLAEAVQEKEQTPQEKGVSELMKAVDTGKLTGMYAEMAQQMPEAVLKDISQQAQNLTADWQPYSTETADAETIAKQSKERAVEMFGEDLVNAAIEAFPAPKQEVSKDIPNSIDLSKTKVVDPDGKPLTVYHSTTKDFDDFNDGVTYFAEDEAYSKYIAKLMNKTGRSYKDISDSEVRTIPVKLNAERVYELPEGEEMNGNVIKELLKDPEFTKKYDAVKGVDLYSDNKIVYAVFDKKNIIKEPTNEPIKESPQSTEQAQAPETGGTTPTIDEAATSQEEGEELRLSHADTERIYEELGLPLRMETPTKHKEELIQQARDVISKGYDFDKVATETMEGTYKFEDVDQAAFAMKVADLKSRQNELDIKSPEFDALQNQIEKYSRASDVAGTIGGRFLQSRKAFVPLEKSISDYITVEKETAGVDDLTPTQKEQVQKEHREITATEEALNQKISALEAENKRLRADQEVKKTAKTTSKTKKDFSKERSDILAHMRQKLKEARGDTTATILPYAKELIAIAPDVAKLMKSYVEQGITELSEIITNIHGQLKDVIPQITEKDIQDIIAGEYSAKKTRNQLAELLVNLRTEAKLLNELERLEKGEKPKNENRKIQHNKKLKELREKIKALRPKTEVSDEAKLAARKTKLKNEIAEIERQIREGDFAEPVKKEPLQLDKEAMELQDKLIKLKQAREIRLNLIKRQNETLKEKALRKTAEVLNIPRTLMTIADFSGLLRQNIFFSAGHPLMTAKATPGMFKSFVSQKVYDRWFEELKKMPNYQVMKDSKLAITENTSLDLSKREEDFMSTLAEKIPVIGKTLKIKGKTVVPGLNIVKGSERSYAMLLNKMRVDMFNYFTEKMKDRGVTPANNPKAYKAMAEYINNATGRSDFGLTLNRIAPILNSVFFSPRLIASRINMLTYFMQPRFWTTLPVEARIDYMRNWVSLLAIGGTILFLAKLGGADVEDDPRSSDFGKIKSGNTRWDIWGGAQPYIRTMAQVISGKSKSSVTGGVRELDSKDRFLITPGKFLRNKLAPIPGAIFDLAADETSVGDDIVYQWGGAGPKEISIDQYIKQRLLPMTATSTEEAMKDQGVQALLTVMIPNLFGVGTSTYGPKK